MIKIWMFRFTISLILWPLWFTYLICIFPIFLVFTHVVNKKYFHYFLSPMCYLFCFLGGQLVNRTGVIPNPKRGPYLYLINHQSLFDHFALGNATNGTIFGRFKPDLIFSGTDFQNSGPGFWLADT